MKTPLDAALLAQSDYAEGFDIDEIDANVGLVICLVKHTRYEVDKLKRINSRLVTIVTKGGGVVPTLEQYDQFEAAVDNAPHDRLIAVHCSHGVNRTGWYCCRYIMQKLNLTADAALAAFSCARGHEIEHETLIDDLRQLETERRGGAVDQR